MSSNAVTCPAISRVIRLTLSIAFVGLAPSLALAASGPDLQLNFKVPGCNCAGGIPPNQYAPSVAAWGPYVLVSWYDQRYRCLGPGTHPAQSYGWSTDYGATFHDGGLLYRPNGTAFFGNPSVTVNPKTGDFYIVGYGRPPTGSNPIFALKGHFEADSFATDTTITVATPDPSNFYERPWVAADTVTGSVHVVWMNYAPDASTEIEYQKLDADLNLVGEELVLQETPYGSGTAAQNPYVAVGPDGEVYVAWARYGENFMPSSLEVTRSDDYGASFGAIHQVRTFQANNVNDPPGSTRIYGMADVSIAVDRSHGPHRGRLYLAWDEPANFSDAPVGAHTTAFEVEGATFAGATPFQVGGKIRGSVISVPGGDKDYWRFSGIAGQTVVFKADTSASGGLVRLLCQSTSDTSTLASYRTLAYAPGVGIVAGLPYTGDYTFQVQADAGAPVGSYVFQTAFDTPTAGDVGRDSRDELVAYSDDGVTWSAPVRVNDSPVGRDGTFATVTVDDEGRVHCTFLDFRNDPCGDLSDIYMASSGDGGVTWGENRRLTDASSYWNVTKSCNLYNRGTYHHVTTAGRHVYAVFPDTRLGDTDIFMDASRIEHAASCPPEVVGMRAHDAMVSFALFNEGSFATPLAWSVTDTQGWLSQVSPAPSGTLALPASGGTLTVTATVALPGDCSGSTQVRFVTHDPLVPGQYDTCVTVVRCVSASDVDPTRHELSFAPPSPSPTRGTTLLRYGLSRTGPVRLELFAVTGARLRVLENGVRAAGPHEVTWDGRDESGRAVPAGAYYVRLEAEARTMRRSLIVVR